MTNHTNQQNGVIFDNRDIARFTAGERRMPMRGFEPQYTDIVDYIVRITHRIWEEKEVGYIYDTYQHNCIVHGSGGDRHGRESVVAATLQALAAFPESRLYGDDVIWTGDEDNGFHTSHLLTEVNVNTGYSSYGPPTGRRVTARSIAHCVAKENKIFEEWVLSDEPHVIRQLGYDVGTVVQRQAQDMLNRGVSLLPTGDSDRMLGQYAPAPLPTQSGSDIEDLVRSTYHEVWNRRRLHVIARHFASSHVGSTTGNRRFHGPGELTSFVLNTLAMFPDAALTVDQVHWNGDETSSYRVAVRWTLSGTHTGYGEYGPPSGARVRTFGLSQHHITNGVFMKAFSLFDEMSVLRQIALQRLILSIQ